MKTIFAFAFVVAMILCFGCSSEDCLESGPPIAEYLQDTSKTFSQDPVEFIDENGNGTGLFYIIDTPGDTVTPNASSTITFTYDGKTTNDETFTATGDSVQTLPLSGLIPAWRLALPLIGQGGEIQLFVPANLAYGSNQAAEICPNSDLIFDVNLIGVEN